MFLSGFIEVLKKELENGDRRVVIIDADTNWISDLRVIKTCISYSEKCIALKSYPYDGDASKENADFVVVHKS